MTFSFKFYNTLILFVLVLTVIFLIAGYCLNENFFLQYSVDKELSPKTLAKIHQIKTYFYFGGFIFLALAAFLLISKRFIVKLIKRKQSMIQNILLLLGVTILLILIGEIILRILISEETSRFGFGPGSLKFNKKYISLNNEGFRDRDYTLATSENTIRIIGLGDSFTYGSGIKDVNNVYLKKLEKLLNEKKSANHEVLNFAKPGINTEEEIKILKKYALKYKPNIIILGYVLNDFSDIENKIKCKSKEHTIPFFGFWLRNFSYLYYFIETRINKLIEQGNFECTYGEYLNHVFESENNRKHNFKYFEELSLLSQENNVKLLVIIFPIIHNLQDYPFTEAHKFVKEAGEKYGFKVIDVLPYYEDYTEKELIVNTYDLHPNELGHELAAQLIYENIVEENYLNPIL